MTQIACLLVVATVFTSFMVFNVYILQSGGGGGSYTVHVRETKLPTLYDS